MAITITAKLDATGVTTGASQVTEAIDGMADKADQSGDSLERMAADAKAEIAKLKSGVTALKGEISQMGTESTSAFNEVESGANDSTRAIDSQVERRDKIKTIAVAYLAVADAVKKAAELGRKLVEVVNTLKENGNPAAIELSESFAQLKVAMLDIAEDPVFQDMLIGIADTIHDEVIPAINAIPDAWSAASRFTEDSIAQAGEFFGIFEAGTVQAMDNMQKLAEVSRENRKKELELTRNERRQKRDADAEAKKAAKDLQDALRDAAEQSDAAIKKTRDLQSKAAADELAEFKKLQADKLDAERRAHEERKRLVQGADVNGVRQLVGAIDPAKLREQFAIRQANEDAANNFGMDQDDLERRRRSILRRARQQFDAGNADPEAVRAAQQELANATIDNAQRSGKVGKDTAEALKDALKEVSGQSNELEQVQREIANLKKLAQGVADNGQRRRAQIQGAGR